MISAIILYLLVGLVTYWPHVYFLIDREDVDDGEWYHWTTAWALWCITWPYWNMVNAWYWWRATK